MEAGELNQVQRVVFITAWTASVITSCAVLGGSAYLITRIIAALLRRY